MVERKGGTKGRWDFDWFGALLDEEDYTSDSIGRSIITCLAYCRAIISSYIPSDIELLQSASGAQVHFPPKRYTLYFRDPRLGIMSN